MTLVVNCTKISASRSKAFLSYSYNIHVMKNVVFLVKAIKAYRRFGVTAPLINLGTRLGISC